MTGITSVLVANRGEIAVRIFETARELGMRCIAIYSDPDRDARHVRHADTAVHLPGQTSAQTYLNMAAVLDAAKRSGAHAIHPGYGFLSENPDFARQVVAAGLIWVGPTPESIEAMALKVAAKRTAAEAGVPLVPGAELSGTESAAEAAQTAAGVGYPLMIKASAGGGGKGMRIVEDAADLVTGIAAARREAAASFGDDTVFLERYLPRARHVEVQVFGDGAGKVLHLFDRECSIQRRHQKIIEEAPSPGTTDVTRERMYAAAVALAQQIDYVGAGTVEFLVSGDGDAQEFFFLEMNTRLQVEHRVTEQITGTDLVRWQLLAAQGEPLTVEQAELEVDGHAIEVRLYAEDPANDFLPSVGTLEQFDQPEPFLAITDTGYATGDSIPQFYDPMIAKIITHGVDREDATRDLVRALQQVAVSGVRTNRDMLLAIALSFPFFAGDTTTAFLAEHPTLLDPAAQQVRPAPAVLVAAAFRHLNAVLGPDRWADPAALATDPVPTRWRNVRGTPGVVGLRWGAGSADQQTWVRYQSRGPGDRREWNIELAGGADPFSADPDLAAIARITAPNPADPGPGDGFGADTLLIAIDGIVERLEAEVDLEGRIVVSAATGQTSFEVVDTTAPRSDETADAGPVAPVPGTVAAVEVAAGQQVSAGQTLVILEAMKMEHRIVADTDGVIETVLVSTGQAVDAHQVLVTFAEAEAADA